MDFREHIGRTVAAKVALGIALLVGFVVFIAVGGFVVQLLWNWLIPGIFGLRQLSWLEALGLLALSRILFGGSGMIGRRSRERRWGTRRSMWWKTPPHPGNFADFAGRPDWTEV